MTAAAEVTALVTRPHEGNLATMAMRIQEIVEQKKLISQVVRELMIEGEHYGVIPGTGDKTLAGADGKPRPPKKVLLKPGADLLCSLFQLEPDYIMEDVVNTPARIYYRVKCVLTHIPTGRRVGAGLGSCNSNEDKYLRPADKRCPSCEKTAIKKSKYPPRNQPNAEPGWYCFQKVGGCGKEFGPDDKGITEQDNGIKDPADLDNTLLKMACKRSRIDGVLTVTAASDFFTQDLEDLTEKAAEYLPPKDDLKEKLATSVEAAIANRDAKKTAHAETAATPTVVEEAGTDAVGASSSSSASADQPRAASDTGEAATEEQKDAIKSHIRKKAWKRGYVRLWFADLFGIPATAPDPLETLTQMQADAAHFLCMAHGTSNYRKIRMEYADQGLVRKDENDLQF